mgnify:CR=1 FL=1
MLTEALEHLVRGIVDTPEAVRQQLRDYFFSAARFGDNEVLDEFIRAGYDLNSADDKGYTALILAAYNGHGETVEKTEDFAPAFKRARATGKASIIEIKLDQQAITPTRTLAQISGTGVKK